MLENFNMDWILNEILETFYVDRFRVRDKNATHFLGVVTA